MFKKFFVCLTFLIGNGLLHAMELRSDSPIAAAGAIAPSNSLESIASGPKRTLIDWLQQDGHELSVGQHQISDERQHLLKQLLQDLVGAIQTDLIHQTVPGEDEKVLEMPLTTSYCAENIAVLLLDKERQEAHLQQLYADNDAKRQDIERLSSQIQQLKNANGLSSSSSSPSSHSVDLSPANGTAHELEIVKAECDRVRFWRNFLGCTTAGFGAVAARLLLRK